MKISFVVAVFNTESYLDKCLQSLINQTLREIEIIVVNDGSTDNSLSIIEKYKKLDNRIKIINKKNGGLSEARNYGIKVATGEYISLIDSDDWIELDLAEKTYRKLKETKSDMCIFGIRYIYSNNKEINKGFYPIVSKVLSNIDTLDLMFRSKGFKCHAVNKICKADIVKKCEYPVGKVFEDVATTYKLIYLCENICFLEDKLYNYLQGRIDSILNSNFRSEKLYIIDTMDEINKFLIEKNVREELEESFNCFYLENLIGLINMYSLTGESAQENSYIKLNKLIRNVKIKDVIKNTLDIEIKIKIILAKINMCCYTKLFRWLKTIELKASR
ncbi:glycosyltransferase family 2 protein [Clostridium gasigenes]|uniref:glycosyltransferase family 2 protein n=1 Tax=Clostridium gasigenes TaxID=94869 RepID=UPI0016262A3E|nr:glycosyltransferase family 2 protein [Clostridium gasigenes]MBB6624108.1 glycosyltransferase family 2 protein [Clostridium gasigenes]